MKEFVVICNEVVGISGNPLIIPDYIDTSKEIVRCRDCRYCMRYWKATYCDYFAHPVADIDGFCAWGEKRDENTLSQTQNV